MYVFWLLTGTPLITVLSTIANGSLISFAKEKKGVHCPAGHFSKTRKIVIEVVYDLELCRGRVM